MRKNLKKSLGIFLGLSLMVGLMPGMAMTARADMSTTYSFEAGLGGWTTIDADGDGLNWMTASDMVALQAAGEVVEDYAGGICSLSYINYVGSRNPDNWFVSPQITLGGSIEFDVKSANASYPDHVGVFVSTAGNTDSADFTLVGDFNVIWGDWMHLSFDLSAYEGKGYVAFRHYNSYDQYFFAIRDVTITCPGNPGMTADSAWLDPIRVKLHEQGRLTENGAESASLEITGSYALPIEFMKYLKKHPALTLTYHVTLEEESFDVVIQGSNAIVDESIEWYGPLWLKANYTERNDGAGSNGQNGTYVVQRGDSLMKIAQKINVTVEELVRLNHISDPNKIWAGQVLVY